MSRATDLPNVGFGIGDYPPQSAQNQAPHGVSNFVDGSGPIFSMYLEMASEEDKKMADGWKADADGILIFTGLFSAAVASLISVSIQDIRPNPQDISNFYLANIYHTVSDSDRSNISSSLLSSPPPFSPPNYAVWVNTLWFMSLVISLTCALLATLLQQWARRYLKITQPRYSPHKRARIRAFFFEGIDKFLLPWAVEALPTLLHVSLFLFLAGLVVFLWNVNITIFKLVLSWVGACTTLYGFITFMPIFHCDSPYHTPLSPPAWHIIIGMSFVIFRALRRLTYLDCFSGGVYSRFLHLEKSYRKFLEQGVQKTAEETALNLLSGIDTRAFLWTFDSSDDDHELERFFSGIPGFRSSKVVDDPLHSLTKEGKQRLFEALIGLLDRTFSSDSLPESDKIRRSIICTKAISAVEFSEAYQWVLRRTIFGDQHEGLRTGEFGRIVKGWADSLTGNQGAAFVQQAILSGIVATAQRRNDPWFILASDELGLQGSVLRHYATQGDSLSLAVLIHIIRRHFDHFWKPSWPWIEFSRVLETASKFNVQDTSPELQHEFCTLWNQIALKAQNDNDQWMAWFVLGPIRSVYITLHRDTDSSPTLFSHSTDIWDDILREPSSYPVCNVAGHIHDDSASTTFARTVLHDNAVLVTTSLASPDTPSSSRPTPIHVDDSLTTVPPLDNDECGIRTFTTGLISTSETSASTPPTSRALTSPRGAVHVQYAADRRTSTDDPDAPLSRPTPVIDSMPTTEFHSLIPLVATAAPAPRCPRRSSAPEMGAAAEGGGSVRAACHKEMDPLYSPLVIHENTMSTPELRSQSPSPPSVNDVAIAGSSWRSLGAGHPGGHLPHPTGQYDIM